MFTRLNIMSDDGGHSDLHTQPTQLRAHHILNNYYIQRKI